jgi:hypothetical protein
MIDPTKPLVVSEANNNEKTNKPVAGFDSRPENINRGGRPKKDWTWAQLLEESAEELMETKDKTGKVTGRKALKQLVAKKLLVKAAFGDTAAARLIMERMDGMPKQQLEMEAKGDWNITLKRDEK